MAELIVRLNYDKVLGCFDVDFDDGEIRLFNAIIVVESMPSPHQLHVMLMGCLMTLDGLLPTIFSVGATGVDPETALCEAAAKRS